MSSGFVMPTKVGVGKHARKDYDLPKQGRVAPSNACVWSGNPPG